MVAELKTLEKLDQKSQPELAEAIKADLARIIRARMPGAGMFPGMAPQSGGGA